jgi:hypothetical protein
VGVGVSHVLSPLQIVLKQSLFAMQALPPEHALHSAPPQSMSVSRPP